MKKENNQFPGILQKETGAILCSKDKEFGEDGIMKLPEKWHKVVEQNTEYVV